jgi:hypothetical protein
MNGDGQKTAFFGQNGQQMPGVVIQSRPTNSRLNNSGSQACLDILKWVHGPVLVFLERDQLPTIWE